MAEASKLNILAAIQYSNNPNEITYRVNQALQEFPEGLNFIAPNNNPNIPARFTSPLIAAITRESPGLVQYLLQNGADPNYAPGQVIGSPLDYALYNQNDTIADILWDAGGRYTNPIGREPSEMNYRQNYINYRPGGLGYQQAQTRFYRGYTR